MLWREGRNLRPGIVVNLPGVQHHVRIVKVGGSNPQTVVGCTAWDEGERLSVEVWESDMVEVVDAAAKSP